jgi:hypothetical protein
MKEHPKIVRCVKVKKYSERRDINGLQKNQDPN